MGLLDQAEKEVDRTSANIILVDSKLKDFLRNSKFCCLWVIIVIELAVVGVLVWQLI